MEREATIIRKEEEHPEFGKMSRIEFDNGSRIYVSKKGWTFKTKEGTEVSVPFDELTIALKETLKLGYTEKNNEV